jgi:shikimate dehydrogenase
MTATHNFLSRLTGVFASPVAENPTGVMVEAAYRHHGVAARYISCDVTPANLEAAVRGAVAMGWVGFNCSLPHKVAVMAFLDEIAESAALIGAVNCVVIRDGRLVGENTDGQGFLTSLRTTVDPRGQVVLVLGAGGAARAIAVELALAGARRILIANRSPERGADLARHVQQNTPADAVTIDWSGPLTVPGEVGIVVNATSIGLFPDVDGRPDLDYAGLREGMVVADVIPNPPHTQFLAAAEAHGCVTLDGLGMLVNQAVIGVKHWMGIDADPLVMRAVLDDLFA